MGEMIRVLLVEPHKHPRLVEVEHTLENLQKLVGGDIAASYPWDDLVGIVYDDDGKLDVYKRQAPGGAGSVAAGDRHLRGDGRADR